MVDGKKINQVDYFKKLGMLELWHHGKGKDGPLAEPLPPALVDPYDTKADLDHRARSYLQVNCAHCHQYNAGGTVDIDLRIDLPLVKTKTVGVKPVQGTFGLPDGRLISPGDPYRSVLYYRMSKHGRGRMPHLGSEIVDERGLRLVRDWLRTLPANADAWIMLHRLRELDETTALAKEKEEEKDEIADSSRGFAAENGRTEPSSADIARAKADFAKRIAKTAKERPLERMEIIRKLLTSPDAALIFMEEMAAGRVLPSTRPEVVKVALNHSDPLIRDLFERFVPENQRIKRLGSTIVPRLCSPSREMQTGAEKHSFRRHSSAPPVTR